MHVHVAFGIQEGTRLGGGERQRFGNRATYQSAQPKDVQTMATSATPRNSIDIFFWILTIQNTESKHADQESGNVAKVDHAT